jgi:hypothetical protein
LVALVILSSFVDENCFSGVGDEVYCLVGLLIFGGVDGFSLSSWCNSV